MKFINANNTDFHLVLKKNVDAYFIENKISRFANAEMVIKTIVMLALYLVPYFLITSKNFTENQMLLFTVIMGFGLAGIGMSIMHDANHGAYSPIKVINTILGYTLNIVGANSYTWKIKHNILHHTYTNINNMDEDIDSYNTMRLSVTEKLKPVHKFQFIYAIFLYAVVTLEWCLTRDFLAFKRYMKKGLIKEGSEKAKKELTILIISKVLYFFFLIALPIMILDIQWWKVLIGFGVLHLTSGLILSITFQLAHVVEKTIFPQADENGNIATEWAIHQLLTTADFCKKNKAISWFIGNLNYQIEHHLFPHICHVHYPYISEIVKKTAEQYNIPYNEYPDLNSAIVSHFRVLKKLGQSNNEKPQVILNP